MENTSLEIETYKKIQNFIQTLPLDQPWRGVMCMNILNGFIDTALKSEHENPHAVMEALDHMFIQMVEVYRSNNLDPLFGELDQEDSGLSSSSTQT